MTGQLTAQLVYDERELLASHDVEEPLIAGGVRCHGGFDASGAYVSPRTRYRVPATRAWQEHHRATFGTELMDLPLSTWPEHYPNVEQSRFLIRSGVPEPVIATLTRIGTVEGFGSMIRLSEIPDRRAVFAEDTDGTALAHLGTGLFEAHARDEAGHEDEGGHRQMWFAARDVAFEDPVTEDETELMLERMGIKPPGGNVDLEAMRAAFLANRLWPGDVSPALEILVERMTRLLLIEISAFHSFAWAETVLADRELVAGDGEAGKLVSYIRADETPHVEYLKTVLTEIRDRTVVGEHGTRHRGADLIGAIWDRAVDESLHARRTAHLDTTLAEISHAVSGRTDAADLLAEFHALGSVAPDDRGVWHDRTEATA